MRAPGLTAARAGEKVGSKYVKSRPEARTYGSSRRTAIGNAGWHRECSTRRTRSVSESLACARRVGYNGGGPVAALDHPSTRLPTPVHATRGKVELRRVLVELSAILARGIEMASPLLEQHHHELTVDVPREGLVILGDPARLAQVVANLLTNAAKYSEPGSRIQVVAHATDDDVVVAVRDSGVGIDAAMLPTIFDLFVQERQSLARSAGGLGLGLTIVRSLVELHGGHVTATSAGRGQGAEFVVTLPRAGVATEEETTLQPPARAAGPAADIRVLVVDDNVDAAELLAELLSEDGYAAMAVHDGPSALAAAESLQPHVALLDIGLPVMDGYELARRFAAHPRLRHVRLVAVTGYGQDADRARSLAAGFAAHLVKPIDIDAVMDVLASLAPARVPQ
jgi:CheY-like chemotaxis protein